MIRFENVSKVYANQHRPALADIEVEVDRGEFVFLVGASDLASRRFFASSCARRATGGHVHVAGKDLNRLSNWKVPALRRQIGTVFQDFRLLPNKTVSENVAFALEVIGKPRSAITRSFPRCSIWLAWMARASGCPTSCPAESSSGSQSPARSSTDR